MKSFVDPAGYTHEVVFLFYQVDDLGADGINTAPNNKSIYAWYAFEEGVCDMSLIGGTDVLEISVFSNPQSGYCGERGVSGDIYWGDFLYFNSDGSLASEGAVRSSGGAVVQAKPHLEVASFTTAGQLGTPLDTGAFVQVNFGTAGMLGYGQRDGLTGDAASFSVH